MHYNVFKGGNEKFFEIFKTLHTFVKQKNNLKEYIKYAIALMRIYLKQGKKDESLLCFDELFRVICDRMKHVKENIDQYIIDPKIAEYLIRWDRWDYVAFYDYINKDVYENLDKFLAYTWYNLTKTSNVKNWIDFLIYLNTIIFERVIKLQPEWVWETELPLDDYDDYRYLLMGSLYAISVLYSDDSRVRLRVADFWENNIRKSFDKIVLSYID